MMLLGQKLRLCYHRFMPSLVVKQLADLQGKESSPAGRLSSMHQIQIKSKFVSGFSGLATKENPTKDTLVSL